MQRRFTVVVAALAAAFVVSPPARSDSPAPVPAKPADGAAAPKQQLPAPPSPSYSQIEKLKEAAEKDPKNVKAWIALGDSYFDTGQREQAVQAYGRALALQPKNPNVLTDQGVMYRELGKTDKAIANFKKANAIDPKHMASLLDLGVTYAQDLKDQKKALATFNHIIEVAPLSKQALKAREYIEHMKTEHAEK
jgi:cytochrome c-type biogenesis protein CcmH/NrfG